MVVREESHPSGTHCMSDKTKHRVWSSFPVLLGCEVVKELFPGNSVIGFHHPQRKRCCRLVGGDWNMFYDFPYIGNFIIPTDEVHHFSEG